MNKKIKNDTEERTYKFAIQIIKLANNFPKTTAAFLLGKQLIRLSTSINSNIIHTIEHLLAEKNLLTI